MGLSVHVKTRSGDFDYVIVGRGTGVVSLQGDRLRADAFRSLLASSEREQARVGIDLIQVAWHLPNVAWVDDPLDVGSACVSYLGRHPRLGAAHVVAPMNGLIRLVVSVVERGVPSLGLRRHVTAADALAPLRGLEPELPLAWEDMNLYPEEGGRLSSMLPPPSSAGLRAGPATSLRPPKLPRRGKA